METEVRNWIVISGHFVDTTVGGGFEFFGPFTEQEAVEVRNKIRQNQEEDERDDWTALAIQLLHYPKR